MAVQGAEEGRCVAHPDLSTLVTIQALEGARCADLANAINEVLEACGADKAVTCTDDLGYNDVLAVNVGCDTTAAAWDDALGKHYGPSDPNSNAD
eukprot:gene20760-11974_t